MDRFVLFSTWMALMTGASHVFALELGELASWLQGENSEETAALLDPFQQAQRSGERPEGKGFRRSNRLRERALSTDRPYFKDSSSVVEAGRAQLEAGYTFTYDEDAAGVVTRSHSGPEMLLRIGVAEHVELRIAWNHAWEREIDAGVGTSAIGPEDIVIGAKLGLVDQINWFPQTAAIIEVTAPTGQRELSNRDVTARARLAYSWQLSNDWILGGTTGYANPAEFVSVALAPLLTTEALDHHNLFTQSLSLGVPLTERLTTFGEYFGLFSQGRLSDRPQNYFQAGLTYLITEDAQLDFRAGLGLCEGANDFFTGMGASVRY
jgi:hypothetical protein